MKIRKDGFMFQVAYGLEEEECKIPSHTSLCKFFWRFMGMLCIWPMLIILAVISMTTFACFGFLFARKISFDTSRTMAIPIEKWPTIKGWRIYPIWPILIGIAIYFAPIKQIWLVLISPTIWLLSSITLIVGTFLFLLFQIPKTETWRLFRGYLKAKKDKTCPTISFMD